MPIVSLGISKFSLPHTKGFTMRHTILTLLLALAINPLKHHFIDTSPRLLKMYDDNLITIEFWESYNLEKHIEYFYKDVDGHRRFKTFFIEHKYDVQYKKFNYFTDTHVGFYNDLVGIAVAYDGLPQDSIARIEPGPSFGITSICYFPDTTMNQPSIIKEENIYSDSVSVFFERIL